MQGNEQWLICLDESRFGVYSLNLENCAALSLALNAYTAIITLIIGNISDPSMPWAENRRNRPSGSFFTILLDESFARLRKARVLSAKSDWNEIGDWNQTHDFF